ncbi:evbL [Yinghuangia aomiensis]|uniref:EvbL n=1 Tax=Yinghuangia aomiensis TaxID=676205 RepID=A0ABP9H2E4_9ACTN
MSGSRMDTARTTNLAVKAAVQQIAPKFFFDPLTTARGAELGYDGLQFYIAGRGGVIGDASDDIVVDAFHYFEPGTIAAMWAAAAKIGTASDAAAAYAECCHAWGRAKLADFDGVDRLAEIAGKIAGANDLGATGRLSSGWRALQAADDAPAAAMHHLQTLREQRADLHALALRAHRIAPLEAQVGERKNEGMIKFFGWTEPFPELDAELEARRADAETLTDDLVAATYAVLDDAESADFARLAPAALAHLG